MSSTKSSKRSGTIGSITRTTKPKRSEAKLSGVKGNYISTSDMIKIVAPDLNKKHIKRLSKILWLEDMTQLHAPSMLTTILKNIEDNKDNEETVEEIIIACENAKSYNDIYWQFPDKTMYYNEEKIGISKEFSKSGGVTLANPCKKCGKNNWRVIPVQTASADEISKAKYECLTCQ